MLRCVGAFADREGLKELLLLEKENGFFLQGLLFMGGGAASDNLGSLGKRNYDLSDERIAEMMDAGHAKRGSGVRAMDREITNTTSLRCASSAHSSTRRRRMTSPSSSRRARSWSASSAPAGSQAGAHTLRNSPARRCWL